MNTRHPTQITLACADGFEFGKLLEVLRIGFKYVYGRQVTVVIGSGEAINGVPAGTFLVEFAKVAA